ncbi:hypothetical protein DD237_005683 [Peronospora effusa]|uniref:Uncharacterized protein n=1 Tax=Peronospora effusa TaxID=542832 RepID=A0A3R7XVR3_9STRA|nr:hypothetical protein DD237_005683 [Peronospora effusa]
MEHRRASLRRDQETNGFRVYLMKHNLFHVIKDPHNSPIRPEKLKELVQLHSNADSYLMKDDLFPSSSQEGGNQQKMRGDRDASAKW